MMKKEELVNELICYSQRFLDLHFKDMIYIYNLLLRKFKIDKPEITDYNYQNMNIDELILNIEEIGIQNQLCTEENKERFSCEIMGDISLLPSKFEEVFWNKYHLSKQDACNYFYNYQVHNDYIKKSKIDLNEKWRADFDNNFLEITINLSKPEKDNKKTAALINSESQKYPKCLLCKENLGYAGRIDAPARENIRTVWMKLNNENWFMQFSPYQYYEDHIIVISENHHNMKIEKDTFIKLCDFVDIFDNYFIGSNTELPIVGGSILDHEHYQGGKHLMPIFFAKTKYNLSHSNYKNCKIEYLDWYNSCFKLTSKDRNEIINLATLFLDKWRLYSDEKIDLICKTDKLHNTITPVVRKVDNEYIFYLILRNNRTNTEFPDGIFHSHNEYHNIKKEAIGLIEAMGLFILPGRLKRQCKIIDDIINNSISLDDAFNQNPDLLVHQKMINELLNDKSKLYSKEKIKNKINEYCEKILSCTGIFKNNEKGAIHLFNYFNYMNLYTNNLYINCKEFKEDDITLSLLKKEDIDDLLICYSDAKATKYFNKDNCNGDDFYYLTHERMKQAVDFWLFSYANRYFIRYTIRYQNNIIGTIELFESVENEKYAPYGLLRIDLASPYEKEKIIKSILNIVIKQISFNFGMNYIITKGFDSYERIKALEDLGFTKIGEDFKGFPNYYVKGRENV